MNRRGFLAAAGLSATAAALSGCTNEGAAPPATPSTEPTVLPTSSTAAEPIPPDWGALRAKLSGGLILPGESAYPGAKQSFNPLFDNKSPAAIARCTKPEDVQACIDVAAKARIPVAARSGGHSYAGYSVPDGGVVVDLSGLAEVKVEGSQATIGA